MLISLEIYLMKFSTTIFTENEIDITIQKFYLVELYRDSNPEPYAYQSETVTTRPRKKNVEEKLLMCIIWCWMKT